MLMYMCVLIKNFFSSYQCTGKYELVMIGNSSAATVLGKGRVNLNLSSGKIFSLHNMQYVPDVIKNLIFVFYFFWLNKQTTSLY